MAHKRRELEKKHGELTLQGGELEKVKAKFGASVQRISEMKEAAVEMRESLDRSEEVRRYLMSTGMQEVMEKIFTSDEFSYYMVSLVPNI